MNKGTIRKLRNVEKEDFSSIKWSGKYTFGSIINYRHKTGDILFMNVRFFLYHVWFLYNSWKSDYSYYRESLQKYEFKYHKMCSLDYDPWSWSYCCRQITMETFMKVGEFFHSEDKYSDRIIQSLLYSYKFIFSLSIYDKIGNHELRTYIFFGNDLDIWDKIETELKEVCEIQNTE